MLRLRQPQESLWDHLLPPQARTLSEELATVDALLSDERCFEPYRQRFHTRTGRPTVPVEQFLRLMYLKHRYTLGYETLVREVADSLHWRRFCHIALDATVPHPTTLSKLVRKYGPEVLHDLNTVLMRKARDRKLLRGRKLRVDTTVIQAPIEHPTDIGLLDDGVRVITRTVKRLQTAGAAVRTAFRDRTRTIKRALRVVGQTLRKRTGDAKAAVEAQTARVLRVARQVVRQAERIKENSRRAVQQLDARTGRAIRQGRHQLTAMLTLTRRVMAQTEQRLQGIRSIPDRLVSVFDPEARPICRGKLSAKTEFGYKALVTETEERLITHYEVHMGNPADSGLLGPAFAAHVHVVDRTPAVAATDRGFGSKTNEAFLTEQGVSKISLPYPGRRSEQRRAHERQRWFRRQQRWRAGQEATISLGSRKYRWRHSRLRGDAGADIWLGWGVLTYNLGRMITLEAARA
ncbi:MAG: ISNCY family transposase [bacterium]|nr:ISNCY family transposase [bacterium]